MSYLSYNECTYREKLFKIFILITYLNFIRIGEVYPFMHNYLRLSMPLKPRRIRFVLKKLLTRLIPTCNC